MRAVVQRVQQASVRVDDVCIASMGEGLLALVGVGVEDTASDASELARKLVHLRVFRDAEGRMNRSLLETGGTLGVVSQFTLLGDVRKGRRPSFASAAQPEVAEPLVAEVVSVAEALGVTVVTGRFQAAMQVALVNDGPVTVLVDTQKRF